MARLPNFLVIIRSEKLSGKGQGRGGRGAKKRTFRFGKKNVSFPKVETFRFADYKSNYLLLKTILHKYCNLIRAKTGLEALALFKENEVDLILMDIKMPEMTGIESLKEIRKLSKDIPVIMQSAYVFDSDMEAAKEAGASGFITKPINLKVLKNTISQYCPSIVW